MCVFYHSLKIYMNKEDSLKKSRTFTLAQPLYLAPGNSALDLPVPCRQDWSGGDTAMAHWPLPSSRLPPLPCLGPDSLTGCAIHRAGMKPQCLRYWGVSSWHVWGVGRLGR